MIYLIQLDNIYKIGKTNNIKQRLKAFSNTHVICKLISIREGSTAEEKILHKVCEGYNIKNELFEKNENVIKIFNTFVFDNLYLKIAELEKEIAKLNNELKQKEFFNNREIQKQSFEAKEVSSENREFFFKGKVFNYSVKYYEKFIKIGNLLYYDKEKRFFIDTYGNIAKKYTNKEGLDMYYIDSGIALTTLELNKIIT